MGGKREGMWTVVSDFFIKNPKLKKKTFFFFWRGGGGGG